MYHRIGSEILERQKQDGWGAKVIDRIALDLREAFPHMRGFSASNLKYMRFFAHECPDRLIGQQSADQLPWFHIVPLLTQLTDSAERGWYASQATSNGWPRATLVVHIKNKLFLRQGAATTNFEQRLNPAQASLAAQILKEPYHAEYALSGIEKPIGVAEYQLVRALPEPLDTNLPSIEEIEAELSREF